ncbi:MAG: NADH-quinone oxidoreductase subunit NuoK [Bdellovibrionales bacterium]|nr:NADH-quinone oxidoreductase subunit NuoK [Bdellovibrionales bacterium]
MNNVTTFYLSLGAVLFSLGVLGVLVRKNTIIVLMCIELMLNAVNISFVALSKHFGTLDGQIYVFFIMSVAAAEVAVGLAIVISVFRSYRSIETDDIATLRG